MRKTNRFSSCMSATIERPISKTIYNSLCETVDTSIGCFYLIKQKERLTNGWGDSRFMTQRNCSACSLTICFKRISFWNKQAAANWPVRVGVLGLGRCGSPSGLSLTRLNVHVHVALGPGANGSFKWNRKVNENYSIRLDLLQRKSLFEWESFQKVTPFSNRDRSRVV